MRKVLSVYLTSQEIVNGQPTEARACPLALAFKRMHRPDYVALACDAAFIEWDGNGGHYYRLLPEAQRWISVYDRQGTATGLPRDVAVLEIGD